MPSRCRDAIGTSVDGTSLAAIQRGAAATALEVRTLKASKERLDELDLPALVHWQGDHWIILNEVRERRAQPRPRAVDVAVGGEQACPSGESASERVCGDCGGAEARRARGDLDRAGRPLGVGAGPGKPGGDPSLSQAAPENREGRETPVRQPRPID
jgi:hypothetical protein